MGQSKDLMSKKKDEVSWHMEDITDCVNGFSQNLFLYLSSLGLPIDSVLVAPKERAKAIFILPTIVERLDFKQRQRAYYISKFVASCGAGLFDAALNYLWDETILNLREKVVRYDLDYFFNAIKGIDRKEFSTAEDLYDLPDWQLIDGCKETEIITLIGYKHLHHIRDMRNWASAAHPNQNELTGLQLADWLETCIREVLAKEPSDAAIIVKKLLTNIREETFDLSSAMPIKAKIQKLPKELSGSLLKSIFGMYVDEKLSPNIKRNIDLISKSVWNQTDDLDKSEIGLRHAFYAVNGDLKRKELAIKFLTNVDGLSYLSEDIKAVEIREKIDNLRNAHEAYQNFYNEEPHARILFNYIHETGEIPESIAFEYVKTLIICRMGNPYGVSRSAEPYYNEMIRLFEDNLIKIFLNLLKDDEIINILEDDTRLLRFVKIAKQLETQTSNYIILKSLKKLTDSKKDDIIRKKTYNSIKILLNSS